MHWSPFLSEPISIENLTPCIEKYRHYPYKVIMFVVDAPFGSSSPYYFSDENGHEKKHFFFGNKKDLEIIFKSAKIILDNSYD